MNKDIYCVSVDDVKNKWDQVRVRVDGKIFPCCIFMIRESEFDKENLGTSAADFEKTLMNNPRKTCYEYCSVKSGKKHFPGKWTSFNEFTITNNRRFKTA